MRLGALTQARDEYNDLRIGKQVVGMEPGIWAMPEDEVLGAPEESH